MAWKGVRGKDNRSRMVEAWMVLVVLRFGSLQIAIQTYLFFYNYKQTLSILLCIIKTRLRLKKKRKNKKINKLPSWVIGYVNGRSTM